MVLGKMTKEDFCSGIATKDAPNMCHGYVALLGSDDQVGSQVFIIKAKLYMIFDLNKGK